MYRTPYCSRGRRIFPVEPFRHRLLWHTKVHSIWWTGHAGRSFLLRQCRRHLATPIWCSCRRRSSSYTDVHWPPCSSCRDTRCPLDSSGTPSPRLHNPTVLSLNWLPIIMFPPPKCVTLSEAVRPSVCLTPRAQKRYVLLLCLLQNINKKRHAGSRIHQPEWQYGHQKWPKYHRSRKKSRRQYFGNRYSYRWLMAKLASLQPSVRATESKTVNITLVGFS